MAGTSWKGFTAAYSSVRCSPAKNIKLFCKSLAIHWLLMRKVLYSSLTLGMSECDEFVFGNRNLLQPQFLFGNHILSFGKSFPLSEILNCILRPFSCIWQIFLSRNSFLMCSVSFLTNGVSICNRIIWLQFSTAWPACWRWCASCHKQSWLSSATCNSMVHLPYFCQSVSLHFAVKQMPWKASISVSGVMAVMRKKIHLQGKGKRSPNVNIVWKRNSPNMWCETKPRWLCEWLKII